MDLNPTNIFNFIQTGGLVAALIIALYALLTDKIYTAKAYKIQEDRANKAEQKLELFESITPRNADNLQRIAELLHETVRASIAAGPSAKP